MAKDRRAGIASLYVITRTATGQTYVGVSIEPRKRWNTHRWLANSGRSNQLLHRAMAKYGIDSFSFEIVACSKTWADAVVAEQDLIRQYGSHVSCGGYNLTAGGEGIIGHRFSAESRARISASKVGRPGRKISEEEKLASSRRLLDRWRNDPQQFSGLASVGGKARAGRKNSAATRRRMSNAAYKVWEARRAANNPLRVPQHH